MLWRRPTGQINNRLWLVGPFMNRRGRAEESPLASRHEEVVRVQHRRIRQQKVLQFDMLVLASEGGQKARLNQGIFQHRMPLNQTRLSHLSSSRSSRSFSSKAAAKSARTWWPHSPHTHAPPAAAAAGRTGAFCGLQRWHSSPLTHVSSSEGSSHLQRRMRE